MCKFINLCLLLGGILCCGTLSFAGEIEDGRELAARFHREAPAAWERLRERLGHVQATLVFRVTQNGKEKLKKQIDIKQNRKCKLTMFSKDDGTSNVEAYNPLYSFDLQKSGPLRSWTVTNITRSAPSANSRAKDINDLVARSWLCASIEAPPAGALTQLIKQPNFRFVSFQTTEKDGHSIVKVTFTNKHPFNTTPFCPVQGGILYLDPSRSWSLVSSVLDTEYSNGWGKWHTEATFAPRDSITPLRVVTDDVGYVIPDDKGREHKVPSSRHLEVDLKCDESGRLPEDTQFTLSAYGFNEPSGMPALSQQNSQWWLWLLALAFVCLGVGIYLMRRAKQRS